MKPQQLILVVMTVLLSACIAPVSAIPSDQAASQQIASEQTNHAHDPGTGLPEELGEVEFEVSCTSEAQAEFNHAAALLHSFWFAPAIQSFNTVAELDATCAMAHWGVAMSLMNNPFTWPLTGQALVDGWTAVEKAMAVGAKTPREQAYIDAVSTFYKDADTMDHSTRALAYAAAMEQLAQEHPEDTEAQIFHAIALVATASPTD